MTDQDKAINEVLDGIIEEIQKWQNRKKHISGMRYEERERGFQEGLRLGGAIVRARYIQEPEEETDNE